MLRKSHCLFASFMLLGMLISFQTSAQNSLFFVFLDSNPDREELAEGTLSAIMEGHLENIDRLYEEGNLLLAGPIDGGGGIFVLNANSLVEAQGFLETDPAISSDRFIVGTHEMEIEKGFICNQEKPYEMVQFKLIRYSPKEGASTDVPFNEHYDYVQTDEVLMSAAIRENDIIEYVIVLPNDADAGNFAINDPLISSGTYDYTVKTWWSTNQTFCTDKSKKIN